MKNDVRKMHDISTEMQINDLLYNIISDELEDMIADCDNLENEFEIIYFGRRVLSVFQNNDMPIYAALGLLDNEKIIKLLYDDKEKYIGGSDGDTDIWNYIVERGYRHYDKIVRRGEERLKVISGMSNHVIEGRNSYECYG